jgi:hypothetical protein
VKSLAVIGAVVIVALLLATRAGRAVDTPRLEVLQGDPDQVDYDYVIPAGTQDRLLRGEPVEIMPATLDVEVGESIRIRNDDDEGAMVGIFYVGAGEVVSMRFTTEGTLSGVCEVNSEGTFTINVAERSA